MTATIESERADEIARACRVLGKLSMTHGGEGHISLRSAAGDSMLIRGKGADQLGVRHTRPSDVIAVDFDANPIAGATPGIRAPSESFLHSWLYKSDPTTGCVIHMHPRHALLLTICAKELFPMVGLASMGARFAVEGVPIYPSCITIHDATRGEQFAAFMGDSPVALMRSHGITVRGKDLEEACVRALDFNELLKLTYEAYLLGDPQPLPSEDIAYLSQPLDPNRSRGSAAGDAGTHARWRYYALLAEEYELDDAFGDAEVAN